MSPSNKFSLFGFSFSRNKQEDDQKSQQSFSPPTNDDGAITISSAAYYGVYVDLDGTAKNEVELISRYREMAMQPEIESALDDIVNEAISQDDDGRITEIVLDALTQPDNIKKAIRDEFQTVLRLLNYKNMAQDIFRRYYVDGKLYYHIIIDRDNPTQGIKELRYVDPRKLRKIREIKKKKDERTGVDVMNVINEYYVFNDKVSSTGTANYGPAGVRITKDSIISVVSGLMDSRRAVVLSYLHKAIKPLNQLRMIEDATVIYRISRAPERRIFYIDVGNLPKLKAEQYLRDIMVKYKNKLVYDANTGEIRDDRKYMSMMEDFWLPRREGGKGTEISTLPGGCFAMDTKVSLLDGRELSIREIEIEMDQGKTLWTYSCHPKTGEIVPGLISWAGVTQKSAKVMRLTLDNGKEIICTPDHKFPIYGRDFKRADQFIVGESLIPLYRKNDSSFNSTDNEEYFDNTDKTWKYTHKMVSDFTNHVIVKPEVRTELYHKKSSINHSILITSIDCLDYEIEVGTLTIDSHEVYHDYHTFALSVGVMTKNSNLGELEDVKYFEKKLYKSLNVPISRLEPNQTFSLGRVSEVTRDELKFAKFIDRLRNKFSDLFSQALRAQCVLKGICTSEEWDDFKEYIYYDFIRDNNFSEMKDAELMQNRLGLLSQVDPYTGRYFSQAWIQRNVLRLTDVQIDDMQVEIEKEKEEGLGVPVDVTNQVVQAQMMNQIDPPQEQQQQQQENNNTLNVIKRIL